MTVYRAEAITRSTDIDGDGIVNNAVYFQLQEEGRSEILYALEHVSHDERDKGFARTFTVAETACRFLRPTHWPTHFEIETRVTNVGRSSFRLEYHIYDAKSREMKSEGYSAQVWLDADGRPREIPPSARKLLESVLEPSIMSRQWASQPLSQPTS